MSAGGRATIEPASVAGRAGADPGLRRQLGLGSATALVVGEVIGVGIFLTPAGMARSLGSPAAILAIWLVMGGVALAGALCFGELAARHPEAGGGYVYLREVYGRRAAFLYGWLSLFVTDPGITAALAVGMAGYVGYLADLSPAGLNVVAVGSIAALAATNLVGLRFGSGVLRALAAIKVGLLAVIVAWGFAGGRGDWSNLTPFLAQRPGSAPLAGALVGGFIAAFFSFGGWWDMTKLAGEVRDPGRTLPRALVLGVATVTVTYLLINLVFLDLLPPARVTSDRAFAALAGEALFGRAGGVAFATIVIVSVVGSLSAMTMAAPRVYYAMARDGLSLPALAVVNPRSGVPARAIVLQAALASALAVSGSFDQILAYFIFPTVAFLMLIVAAAFARRAGDSPRRVPGYPLTPLAFLIPTGILLILLAADGPLRALAGTTVVALGLPAYRLADRGRPAVVEGMDVRP